jgi:predicted metal-dependent enzyme (double-stranded beta helix superfamily)
MATRVSRRVFLTRTTGLVAAAATANSWVRPASAKLPERFDSDRFVEAARKANAEGQAAVDEVLAKAVAEPRGVVAALGEPSQAGLDVLYRGKDLTILNVIWAPLMVLLPHNHNMWASIGIYTGREDNILWEARGGVVEAKSAASLSEKEVFPLGADGIHSVVNPIPRLTGAIHIYGGDFFAPGRSEWDAETLRQRPFDVDGLRDKFREANERFKGCS